LRSMRETPELIWLRCKSFHSSQPSSAQPQQEAIRIHADIHEEQRVGGPAGVLNRFMARFSSTDDQSPPKDSDVRHAVLADSSASCAVDGLQRLSGDLDSNLPYIFHTILVPEIAPRILTPV
jgi:hypothetical protein